MYQPRARRWIRRITLLPAILWIALAGAALAADRPLILLTNDDGVGATGLEAMYRSVKDLGEVVVVAPAENQSGVATAWPPTSRSISRLTGSTAWTWATRPRRPRPCA